MASPLAEAIIAISVDQTAMRSQLRSVRNYINEQARLMAGSLAAIGSGLVLKGGMDYENKLNSLKAILYDADIPAEKLAESLEALRRKTIELGTTTMFSASETAEAMRQFAQLGFDAGQTLQGIPDVLNLAAAGSLSLAEATEFTGQVLRQFNMTTAETTRVADVLSYVANKSSTDVRKLALGLSYTGSEAHKLGQSFEETAAAIGILSNAGQTGSRAGTGLRVLLTQLAKADVAGKFKDFGIEIKDATNNMRPLNEIVNEFNAKTAHLSNVAQQAFLSKIFTIRGATATLGLLAQGQKKIVDLADAAKGAQGYSNTVREIMESGVSGSFRRMRAAVTTVLDDLVTRFAGLGLVFGMIRNTAAWFAGLPDTTKDMAASFVQVAGAVALATFAFPRLIGFIGLFTSAVTGPMNAAFFGVFRMVRALTLIPPAAKAAALAMWFMTKPLIALGKWTVAETIHLAGLFGWGNAVAMMFLKLASTVAMVAGPFGILGNVILSFGLMGAQIVPIIGFARSLRILLFVLSPLRAGLSALASLMPSLSGMFGGLGGGSLVAFFARLRGAIAAVMPILAAFGPVVLRAAMFLGLFAANLALRSLYRWTTGLLGSSRTLQFIGFVLAGQIRALRLWGIAFARGAGAASLNLRVLVYGVTLLAARLLFAAQGFHRLAMTQGPLVALAKTVQYLSANVSHLFGAVFAGIKSQMAGVIRPIYLFRAALLALALAFGPLGGALGLPLAGFILMLSRSVAATRLLRMAWVAFKNVNLAAGVNILRRTLGFLIQDMDRLAEKAATAAARGLMSLWRWAGSVNLSFGGLLGGIRSLASGLVSLIARSISLSAIWQRLDQVGNFLSRNLAQLPRLIGSGAVAAVRGLGQAYLFLERSMLRAARAAPALALTGIRRAMSGMAMAVSTVLPLVLNGFRALGAGIISALSGAFNFLTQLPALIASGLASIIPGIIGFVGAVIAAVNPVTMLAVALGAVAAFITGGFVVALLGLAAGFAGALKDPKYADDLKATLQELLDMIRGIAGEIIGLDQGMDIWASMKATAVATMKAIRDWVKENRDAIVSFGRQVYAAWWMAFGKAKEIVGGVWEYIKSVYGQIKAYVIAHADVFRYWGVKIVQIATNAFRAVKDIVLGVVGWIVRQWQNAADASGITWDGVLETITGILERIAYWTNDLGKTWDYVMKSMALSSSESADAWADTWADIKGLADGTWSALVAGASAATSNILRLFEGLGDGIAAVASGMFEALKAGLDPFGGTSPQQAFKAAFTAAMAAGSARPALDVGEEMAKAFEEGVNRHQRPGESPLTRKLRAELAAMKADLDKLDAERRAAAELRIKEIEGQLAGGAAKVPPGMVQAADEDEPGTEMNRTFKYEFVGIADLAKKIQEGLQPSTEKKQAADQAKAIMQVDKNIKVLPGKMDKMIEGIDRLNDNQGAVFA